jgi:hypothetical protein
LLKKFVGGVRIQESGELRMNNNQLNGLFTDFMLFNPYFYRF